MNKVMVEDLLELLKRKSTKSKINIFKSQENIFFTSKFNEIGYYTL